MYSGHAPDTLRGRLKTLGGISIHIEIYGNMWYMFSICRTYLSMKARAVRGIESRVTRTNIVS